MSTQLLRAPGHNPTPRRVVAHTPGMVCLDTTCVTPACRWFSLTDMVTANDRATVAAALKAPERIEHVIPDTDWPVEQYTPRKPLVVMMPADMMASIRQAMYCNIAVVASTRAAA